VKLDYEGSKSCLNAENNMFRILVKKPVTKQALEVPRRRRRRRLGII
jgi:hypothetical protein